MIGANSYEASLMKALGFSADQVMLLLGPDVQRVSAVYKDADDGDRTYLQN